MAARMPAASSAKTKRKAKADDISEKDEFHLPQIVSQISIVHLYNLHLHILLFNSFVLNSPLYCSLRKRYKSSPLRRI